MLLEIDHHSGVPIYRQVIEQIRRQIMAGRLSEGEQLMSVRELAAQLRVNPMTISKAYALLEVEGLVERRRGIGLFAAKLRKDKKAQTRAQLLEEILRKAAVTAVQLGIPEKKAGEMLARLYRKYDSGTRSHSNE
ncbi:MAG: GntR family transcriptional regulator [Phycisphaerae bacterium]|nr:GntR family transcriptional regulator [Phycisphaerae bacterium]NIP54147.1 GntR family transcriptional regulator [Phycisphaerae bacterium]NIS53037.1 GntR family transcriptional regulator [Phycisphaerae bacterium]NIU10055.1 GntR family transcriptional regulator [Phycisphaerae bacterium]NIU57777.1 GntR family transcriptional regulator [Phycisphaerae bacterium]